MKPGILVLLICLSVSIASAQDTTTLSLNEAISLGVKNSKQLIISKEKINAATNNTLAANQAKLPNASVSGSYLRLAGANVKINKSGNTGGNPGENPSPSSALYGIANVSYPIYAGGKIKYGIESAKFLEKAAILDADNDKDDIIFNISNAYINLYKTAKAVKIVEQNLLASRSRDITLQSQETNGILARNDLLKSQLQTSRTELALLEAESNYEVVMVNMNIMLGLPDQTIIKPSEDLLSELPAVENYSLFLESAYSSRKDLKAIDARQLANTSQQKVAKAEAYPTVALTGGYIAADIPGVLTITNAMNVGIGVQYNISNIWKKNTKLATAKSNAAQLQAGEDLLKDQIKSQINSNYQSYILATKKLIVYKKAQEQAAENARITKNKFDNSLATITDLLEADASLLQSDLNIELSKADIMLAYKKLQYSNGTINQ